MRIISGTARGTKLSTLEGDNTRPTLDRVKEPLFSIIQNKIKDAIVLDLFSGSGALALEALSRGAQFCVFIEKNRKAAAVIEDNLKFTKLADRADVWCKDIFQAVAFLENEEPFDCIFMDPPYNQELEKQVLELLRDVKFVNEDTRIIVEASLETDFSYLEELGFSIDKIKRYKTNQHIFIRKA